MMLRSKRPEFGAAVARVLEEHGLTQRGQKRRTGIDHPTIGEWLEGWPPAHMDKIVAWCRGFELPLDEWLELAGFDPLPISPNPEPNGYDLFTDLYRELALECRAAGVEPPRVNFQGGVVDLSPEEARNTIDRMRRKVLGGTPSCD